MSNGTCERPGCVKDVAANGVFCAEHCGIRTTPPAEAPPRPAPRTTDREPYVDSIRTPIEGLTKGVVCSSREQADRVLADHQTMVALRGMDWFGQVEDLLGDKMPDIAGDIPVLGSMDPGEPSTAPPHEMVCPRCGAKHEDRCRCGP